MAFVFEQRESDSPYVDQAGYADQPHLTRALRRFAGLTPGELTCNTLPLSLV